jgi:hypothetical protein
MELEQFTSFWWNQRNNEEDLLDYELEQCNATLSDKTTINVMDRDYYTPKEVKDILLISTMSTINRLYLLSWKIKSYKVWHYVRIKKTAIDEFLLKYNKVNRIWPYWNKIISYKKIIWIN